MPDLLIELFSEEIPARMQGKAAQDMQRLITDGLVEAGLTYGGAQSFATPRRLTLAVEGLTAQSPTLREERRGPKVGAPEKAIEGFCRGAGVDRADLVERDEKKGRFYFATVVTPGRPAAEIIAEVLEKTVRGFPWPKAMRWGGGPLRWVRPLQRILCILTDEVGEATVVPLDIDGITAGAVTEGHRVMGGPPFAVTSFDDYEAALKRNYVVLSAEERAQTIRNDAENLAFARGLEVVEDAALLREVAGLVEWPVVLVGAIDAQFLDLPPEVLQTSMREHQKFFSLKNPSTGRIEGFVTVANVDAEDGGAVILAGNRKVLAARLSDAAFFWENDLRVAKGAGLDAWTAQLSNVTFHNKLGSQADRIGRIAALARDIAPVVGADPDLAEQAARVAKADLSSEMVYEFPELQGLMGRYYAEAAGLDPAVAAACQEHYQPLGPSDDVPAAPVSVAVALADKLDTLTGFWAIDEKPTGSKDPFALRRAALGVIRLVLANSTQLPLSGVFLKEIAFRRGFVEFRDTSEVYERFQLIAYKAGLDFIAEDLKKAFADISIDIQEEIVAESERFIPEAANNLLFFFHDRLKVFLRDEGVPHDVIDACLAMPGSDDIALLVARARALAAVLKTEDGANLVQGFKRANNILTQAEAADGVEYSYGADQKFAETDAERALFAALAAAEAAITPAMADEDFAGAMAAMATLRGPIDAFFEAVQVNTDNQVVRRNRLNLLGMITRVCSQVADLTRIEGA